MINIAKKKLPGAVVGLLVYLSYCAAFWYVMRGSLAYLGQSYGLKSWFVNDAWAFFIGGLLPTVIFYFFTWFTFRLLTVKAGGDTASVRYGLCLTVIAANVLLFALKFMYIALPLYASTINIILDPVITVIFVALYLWYAFRMNYVDKSRYRFIVAHIFGMFLAVYGVLALLNLIMSLAA